MKIKVYNEDVDAYGIAHHAKLLLYLERARIEFLEANDLKFSTLIELYGGFFVIKSLEARYRLPVRLGETLNVKTFVLRMRRASLIMEQHLYRGSETVMQAVVEMVWLDAGRLKPVAMPSLIQKELDCDN